VTAPWKFGWYRRATDGDVLCGDMGHHRYLVSHASDCSLFSEVRCRGCVHGLRCVLAVLTLSWRTLVCKPFVIFTSMFVERMEVLEHRQQFEVELSTFPDSTNTETPRKLVFSLTCVCVSVCVCEKVFQCISYERVDRFGWKLRGMLQLASNRESPLTSTIGPLFPLNLGRGVICAILWTLYLENHKRHRKTEKTWST